MNLNLPFTSLVIAATRSPLDSISLLLGQIINAVYTGLMSVDMWSEFLERMTTWYSCLPSHMHPFSTGTQAARSTEGPLPRSWFLQDTYGLYMIAPLIFSCGLL